MSTAKEPIIEPHILEGVCQIIAHMNDGLSGTEIGRIMSISSLRDITPGITKWKRLYNSCDDYQYRNQCSNGILTFLQNAMKPARYIGKQELFEHRRSSLNKRLCFAGYEIKDTGQFRKIIKSKTITEAEERADKFKHKLENRNTHAYVFKYCTAELMVENYFHSVFEATKSIADRVREITGSTKDGVGLIEEAFSLSKPLIKVNNLATNTDKSIHIGLANVAKGIFSLIRNPTAHEPKIAFAIAEDEALDMMAMISYVHKWLDKSIKSSAN